MTMRYVILWLGAGAEWPTLAAFFPCRCGTECECRSQGKGRSPESDTCSSLWWFYSHFTDDSAPI